MPFYADLHVHSKYSRATSRNCDLEHLALWARRKGLTVVATGDFTHPAWWDEIRDKLVPAEPGLFRLRPDLEAEVDRRLPTACRGPVRFLLEVEISTIYKKGDKTRKVHHLIYAPDLDTAGTFRDRLGKIGNINSDGRPILGLDSRHLLEITLESGPGAYLIPAHIWTPWFAVLGSKSGFDRVEDCYGDLTEHIFAVETGLSSDPPMNWRVSDLDRYTLVSNSDAHSPPMLGREACVFSTDLDYFAIRRALETGEGYDGTVEFFPEEGKYHMDGHRACGVRLDPVETRRQSGRCPECGKPLTVGVLHRVEDLADRPEGVRPDGAIDFRSLVPLPEIISEIAGVGPKSKTVERRVGELSSRLGPELDILERLPMEEVRGTGDSLLTEALERLRSGTVHCQGGYDGEYGTIRLFEPGEIEARQMVAPLFDSSSFFGPAAEPELAARPASAVSALTALPPDRPALGSEQEARPPKPEGGTSPPPPAADGSILDRLDPDQRAAAEVVSGPLLIIAGPGTGKTRTLTHRLAHLIATGEASAGQCLALTFTRRAAEEMSERLDALLAETPVSGRSRPTVTTFHGLGLEILREQRVELGLQRGFGVADPTESFTLVRELFELSTSQSRDLLAEFSRLRRGAAEEEAPGREPPELHQRLARYRKALRERDLVDFDDLLALPVQLLESSSFQGQDLRALYRQRFRQISIDEYQDIDPLQYRLVRLLAAADGNVCAIGDPDQSIYGFRGADVGFFLRFREDYPGAGVVHLARNYRSSRTIVDAAVQAIAPASLVADRELRAMVSGSTEPITVHTAADERAEARFVARRIDQLLCGTSHYSLDSGRVDGTLGAALSFDDFAVLYRTDAQSAAVIEALEEAGVPFQKRSHDRLSDRPGVRELLAALGEETEHHVTLPEVTVPLAARLEAAAQQAITADPEQEAAIRNARQLLTPLASEYADDDLESFLAAVALGAEVDTWDPRAERVSLLTLHAAKGLEFPVVFLVGCDDGLLPMRRDDSDLDEERRLFFVGMTRARSRLFLCRCRRRRRYGKVEEMEPSPFLWRRRRRASRPSARRAAGAP